MPADDPLDAAFRCLRLSCTLSVRVCLVRQEGARRGRTKQKCRGQGVLYPSCFGCPQGAALAASTPGADAVRFRGAGRGWLGRFEKGREGGRREAQEHARERLRVVGLLDEVPTFDHGPPERDGEG